MRKTLRRGFTLVEVAILLVIVGLALTSVISVISPVLDSRKAEVTAQRLTLIQKALQTYVIRYGCLPCPAAGGLAVGDANAGLAQDTAPYTTASVHCTDNACLAAASVVPWRDIGLSEEEITDGWGDRIRYGVASGTPCNPDFMGVQGVQSETGMMRCGLASFPQGGISVDDIDSAGGPEVTQAAYVLVSSGADQALALRKSTGSATANKYAQSSGGQNENFNGDAIYAAGAANTSNDASHFDDMTRFMTAPNMILACGAGACGNPN